MMIRTDRLIWAVVFGGLFLLAQYLLFWPADTGLGPFGLPVSVFYFIGLQLLLAVLLALFLRPRLR